MTPWLKRDYRLALLMATSTFFTLIGYELIRSPATVLFKNTWGPENLPLIMACMPVVVFGGVAGYGWLLTRLGPRRTLRWTTLGSAGLVLLCILLIDQGSRISAALLFLLKEFYIVLLIEQYWSFINSSISADSARRVNGPVTGVAGVGGALGGLLVGHLAQDLGSSTLVMLAAATALPSLLLAERAYARFGEPPAPAQSAGGMGLGLFRQSPMLRCLLAIVIASQVAAAVLDFKFQELLSLRFQGATDAETAFQGRFFGVLNTSVLVVQFVVTPLLLGLLSLRTVHILMPAVHLAAIAWAVMDPSLLTVGTAFFLFKAVDYSLFRAAKEILYIPLGYDERYRAKEVIDVFGYRSGKGITSVAVTLLQRAGIAFSNLYVPMALAAVGLWLMLVFPLTRPLAAKHPAGAAGREKGNGRA